MRLFNYLEGIEFVHKGPLSLDMEISGVTSRSSSVRQGYIFVCIKGINTDGHLFACEAKRKGACLLVVEEENECVLKSQLPYIKVENTRRVLSLMCAKHMGNPEKELKMIAVTGTNGKTSTCRILTEIYKQSCVNAESLGTLNGGLTTPDPEDLFRQLRTMFDRGVSTVVMEASSHALALEKLYGVKFQGGIFTNLTPEHLDFHNNMDEYAMAKAKLFMNTKWGLYNSDDKYYKKVSCLSKGLNYTYSLYGDSDFRVENLKNCGTQGFSYDLVVEGSKIKITSCLSGIFNIYNTMAAASAAYLDNIDPYYIEKGVACVKGVTGRLEKLDLGNIPFSVYIDYAHSPDALEKVLNCIREFRSDDQKITVVFGCGGDRDRSKRRVMGQIASRLADFVIVTADNSRSENTSDIISEIMKGVDKERPHIVIENRKMAIEYAIENCSDNGIVLLCGKGHENYEIDKFGKRYFSEREIAADAVGKRFKKQ